MNSKKHSTTCITSKTRVGPAEQEYRIQKIQTFSLKSVDFLLVVNKAYGVFLMSYTDEKLKVLREMNKISNLPSPRHGNAHDRLHQQSNPVYSGRPLFEASRAVEILNTDLSA